LHRATGMLQPHFLLKTAPPRLARGLALRGRLEQRWAEVADRAVILVTAPQGFGKTTLLAQWRRNWLERGAFVAWASLDPQDDRSRFVELLLYALRAATGRESFSTAAAQSGLQQNRELDALTSLLAEVALLATPTVIVLDDAHRMPQDTLREMLSYLLHNAPPNLQFLVGSRRPLELALGDLMAGDKLATLDAGDLRFTLDESAELLRARFGNQIGLDDAARLYELTEGWPLGLQLAASTIERAADVQAVIGQLSARRGDLHKYFLESLLSRLELEESAFLVRISILDTVNAELCDAVSGRGDSARQLERLLRETPFVVEGEDRDWLRLHAMARDFLLGQFDKLPVEERRGCYARAARWFAAHGSYQEAARSAWSAGDEANAVAYAARCLRDIAREGRIGEARDWLRRLPASAMARDVRLQLTAAWIRALGDTPAEVPALIERIRKHPQFDEECRLEAALTESVAAVFLDKPGLIARSLEGWPRQISGPSPLHVVSLANSRAMLALLETKTEEVRQLLLPARESATREPLMRLPLTYCDFMVGLSYLWEGQLGPATAVLQPALDRAEAETGRRSLITAVLAGGLAAVRMLEGDVDRTQALLAGRLDAIERVGAPDSIILAYRALAEIALRRGEETRALEALSALYEIGVARDVPRLVFVSLCEQLRVHAVRDRSTTATELLEQLESMRPAFEQPDYRPFLSYFERSRALAGAYVRLATGDLDAAEAMLEAAYQVPASMRRNPVMLTVRALRAVVAHRRGDPRASQLLAETLSLAELGGMRQYIEGIHPALAEMLKPGSARASPAPLSRSAEAAQRPAAGKDPSEAPAGLLTPKEARVLSLLSSGMANKEIARAMDIGEQTVKWHLKNVFFKLNAASRRHAVDRARLLGLLAS
jgi:LuxR family maltose regulon positive regulatory protein